MSIRIFRFIPLVFLFTFVFVGDAATAQNRLRIAILGALPPLTDATDAENAAAVLKRDGFAPEIVTPEQIADPQFFMPSQFAALIAPHCRLFPAVAQANLLTYLRERGRLLCIGGPAFERYAYRDGAVWKTRDQWNRSLPAALAAVKAPNLPTVSPPAQVFHVGSEIAGAWLPAARERGIGFSGSRPGRLLPADARGTETDYSPEVKARQWGYLCLTGPMRGAIWGQNPKVNAPNEPTFTPLTAILKRILQGAYLTKAGAEFPAYTANAPVVIGTEFINFGVERRISVEIEIHSDGEQPFHRFIARPSENLRVGANSGYSETLQALPPGSYMVRVTLFEENGAAEDERPVLDRLTAPFRVLPAPNRNAEPSVKIEAGAFLRHGKAFHPNVFNFAPSWTIGQNSAEKERGWLAPEQYDPELIARDLTAIARRGVNVARFPYSHSNETPALLDFLEQCRNLNLLADVILPGTAERQFVDRFNAVYSWRAPVIFGVEITGAGNNKTWSLRSYLSAFHILIGFDQTTGATSAPIMLKPVTASAGADFIAANSERKAPAKNKTQKRL